MAAEDGALRVDPAVMAGCVQALSGAGDYLQQRLAELDERVGLMLAGWAGRSGAAYSLAWQRWHRGAGDVELGLSMLAKLVEQAGAAYGHNESAAEQALRTVDNG